MNGGQRLVLKRPGRDVWLLPHPATVALAIVFLYLGIGFVYGAVQNLAAGIHGGWIALVIGVTIFGAGAWQAREARPVRLDAGRRELRLPGTPPISLARVRSVVVRSAAQSAGEAAIELVLDDGTRWSLGGSWPRTRAELLARHVAGIVGCEAQAPGRADPRLPPIAPSEPWRQGGRDERAVVRVARACALALFVLGTAGFLSGFALSLPWAARLDALELPLGDPQGIAVDSAGRIYVGSRAYRRIHRYQADGSFDRAWHAEVGKGVWQLAVDADDRARLRIGGSDRGKGLIVTADDRLERYTGAAEPHVSAWQTSSTTGPQRSLHVLHAFPARVTRSLPGERPRTVVSQGWLMLAVTAPLPAWLVAALGAIGLVLLERRTDRTGSPEESAGGIA